MSILRLFKPLIEKFPTLANYYRYSRDSKQLRSEVQFREKLGFYFNGNLAMQEGVFEPDETRLFESIIGFFDAFVNIGSNTGYYVCKALNSGIDTVAFEPNQLNVNILLRNIEANCFNAKFQLFPVALSNQLGVLPMYGASTGASLVKGWAGQVNSTLVPITTFDKTATPLIENKKCFVLIDIEGAELGCLKGAESLLLSDKDNVFLIEIGVREHQPSGTQINPNLVETFELMFSYGYSAYTADSTLREVKLSEVKQITATAIDSLHTHNFLFVKSNVLSSEIGL